MKIAHIASEVAPWSQTGGLADVVASLPTALQRVSEGQVQCAVFAPFYRGIRERVSARGAVLEDTGVRVAIDLAGIITRARFYVVRHGDAAPVYLLDCPGLYDRHGIYTSSLGTDHNDNHLRFGYLCRAALDAAPELMDGVPDIIHAHDWQAGLAPVYLRTRYRHEYGATASVYTIHNLAYQGVFHKDALPELGLDWSLFDQEFLEYYDAISLMKGGIALSDVVTTVSQSYAREVLTPEFGVGLHGFLRTRPKHFLGILNGIDTVSWNPATDRELAANFDAETAAEGKRECRRALAREFGLSIGDDELLVAVVARLTGQKGLDLVADIVPELHTLGAKLVVLGSGSSSLQERFRYLANTFSRNVAVRIGFDVAQSRRIYAGADAFLVPSRFEPCGLSQMYAMRYGTVPIVHAVGGLRDTVHDPGDNGLRRGEGTGFRFEHPTAVGLHWAIGRAARMFRESPDAWQAIVRADMAQDWSWDGSARKYLSVYSYLHERRQSRHYQKRA